MKLVTWNIQWGLGCDGRVDLRRIVETARALCDADVYCFQEVSHGFEGQDGGEDQPSILAGLLPGFAPIFRPAVETSDRNGRPQLFGNMILSRLPVLQIASHLLPWPALEKRSMQRQALEAVIAAPFGAVRVVTTHLEYHSALHREAQVERLRSLNEEAEQRSRVQFTDESNGPYRTVARPMGTILCGDFNLEPDDALHAAMLKPMAAGVPPFADAWRIRHGALPHAPTAGIGDVDQWPQGPHCRDYVFVSAGLADRIAEIRVDTHTTASDHQPVALELDDRP